MWTGANPVNTKFGRVGELAVANSTPTSALALAEQCIDQPGTSVRLEAITDRLMMHAWYRNMGDHEVLVFNQTVDGDGAGHAGIRWYEVRKTNPANPDYLILQHHRQPAMGPLVDLPARHLLPGYEPPLDGQYCDGSCWEHGVRLQCLQHHHQSFDPLHWPFNPVIHWVHCRRLRFRLLLEAVHKPELPLAGATIVPCRWNP